MVKKRLISFLLFIKETSLTSDDVIVREVD